MDDDDLPLVAYSNGSDTWEFEQCLNGDLLLENSWRMTPGLYWDTEIGEGPDSWSV